MVVRENHFDDDQKTITAILAVCDQFSKFCRDNDIVQSEYFLNNGLTHLNSTDDDGLTALQLTSAYNHLELTESLINNGAYIDACNNYGFTALHHACFNGNAEIVALLLRKGADIEYRNIFGCSPLALSCKKGHGDVAKILLDNGAEIESDEEDDGGLTSAADNSGECCHPLLLAVIYSHENVVRILLENGANVNKCVESTGYSPLMYAALKSPLPILQILIDNGADVDYRNSKNQKTALDLAVSRSSVDIVAFLEQCSFFSKNSRTSTLVSMSFKLDIMEAIRREDYSRVEEILREGDENSNLADTVNSADGCTPLILASILGHLEICQLLVAKKAELNRRDKIKGWTALMQACFFRRVSVAKYLIWAGANCTLKSDDGYTALDLAIISDYSNIPDGGILALLSQKCVQQEEEISAPPAKHLKSGRKCATLLTQTWRCSSNYSLPRRKRTLSASSTSVFQFFHRKIRTTPSLFGESSLKIGGSSTRRWSLKPRNWWNRFKMRLRHRSNSITTLASVPLLNNGKISTLTPSSESSIAASLPMKHARKSQSVGDLLNVKFHGSKSSDQVLSTLIQNMNVTPPFDPRNWPCSKVKMTNIETSCPNNIGSSVKNLEEEDYALKPSLAMQNAFKMRPPKRLPERTSPMHKYENIMAALNLPVDLHQNQTFIDRTAPFLAENRGGQATSPNSSFSLSSISNGSATINGHFPHYTNNHASSYANSYSHTVHGPLISGSNNRRRGPRSRQTRRPHSYHDVFDNHQNNSKIGAANSVTCATSLGASRSRLHLPKGSNHAWSHRFPPPNAPNGHATTAQQPLPVTPTRKLMFKFTEMQSLHENNESEDNNVNGAAACQITKFNSSPLLNERASNDDNRSTSVNHDINELSLQNQKNNRQFQSDLDLNQQDPLILINKRLSQITTNFSIISGMNNLHLTNSLDKLKIEENQMQNVWKQIAAEPYSSVFDDEEMDLDTFLTLTDGDLREMGLQDPGQRTEILKLVRQAKLMIKNQKNRLQQDEISSLKN